MGLSVFGCVLKRVPNLLTADFTKQRGGKKHHLFNFSLRQIKPCNCVLCSCSTNSRSAPTVPAAVQENDDQAVCGPGHQETTAGGTGPE